VVATDTLAAVSELAWLGFIQGGPPGGFVPEVLLQSWERSRIAGVDPQPGQLECSRVDESDLQRRLLANRELLDVSVPHVERLSKMLARERHLCSIRDRDGIILYATGTDEESRHRLGVLPGYDWSEACKGTTAPAVCLAEDQPYTVIGPEHFVDVLHSLAGYAAPIHSTEKSSLAVLSLTIPVAAQQLALLLLVSLTAHLIEEKLMRGEVPEGVGRPRRKIIHACQRSHGGIGRKSSSTEGAPVASRG
jgi:transcriptional regulator of acetoin/glycerol metabolism